MEEDVERTIERINERIKELEDTKKVLMQTFGIKPPSALKRRERFFSDIPTPPARRINRRDEIKELLIARGPMAKADILKERPDIPEGTVSYVLNDSETFRNVDGKWNLIEGEIKDEVSKESKSQEAPF
jgi:hypothetical protein